MNNISADILRELDIAVLIPCYNEATTIEKVINDFRAALPDADIYVYDNNSSDATMDVAARAGAIVRSERNQGKGHVVRRMFADIDADLYVMTDGDATYDAGSVKRMLKELIDNHLDMVCGKRVSSNNEAYRTGHAFGNRLLTGMVAQTFGNSFQDMLTGYRAFSRRFVKSFPILSTGFEIETELTIHALSLSMPVAEIDTPYHARPEGSESKLSTVRDGARILVTIVEMTKEERPLFFFSIIFAVLAALSLILAYPVFTEWLQTGLVPRFPTAILSAAIMLLAFISMAVGFMLSSITRARREAKRLQYLSLNWLKNAIR
ncbi:MAG: glycosyltransferase [Chromatiales bacterium]